MEEDGVCLIKRPERVETGFCLVDRQQRVEGHDLAM